MSDTRPLDDICILNNNNVLGNNESIIIKYVIEKEKESSEKFKNGIFGCSGKSCMIYMPKSETI